MDILAGLFAYVAGIGALLAGLAVSFFFFVATPNQPSQSESRLQSASAMLVRPSAPSKSTTLEPRAKQIAGQSEKHAEKHAEKPAEKHAAASTAAAQPAAFPRNLHRKGVASAAQLRRFVQEGRARRWAYQHDTSFESRFLGYAD